MQNVDSFAMSADLLTAISKVLDRPQTDARNICEWGAMWSALNVFSVFWAHLRGCCIVGSVQEAALRLQILFGICNKQSVVCLFTLSSFATIYFSSSVDPSRNGSWTVA